MSKSQHFPIDDEQSSAKKQWEEMREESINNEQDPSLQAPQEANTQKHINFPALEDEGKRDDQSSNKDDESQTKKQWQKMREENVHNEQDPTLQAPQEANTQKHINFLETGEDDENDENE